MPIAPFSNLIFNIILPWMILLSCLWISICIFEFTLISHSLSNSPLVDLMQWFITFLTYASRATICDISNTQKLYLYVLLQIHKTRCSFCVKVSYVLIRSIFIFKKSVSGMNQNNAWLSQFYKKKIRPKKAKFVLTPFKG